MRAADAERHRFAITDAEAHDLARYATLIEAHYGRPMDIEWGRDGIDGRLYILQARPETVKSREGAGQMRRYRIKEKSQVLASGRAIGQKVGQGPVRLVKSIDEMDRVKAGDVLVAEMTDPTGTRDEAGGGHRHEPRRPHLSCGDRRA